MQASGAGAIGGDCPAPGARMVVAEGKRRQDDHGARGHHTQSTSRDPGALGFWGLQFAFICTRIPMKQLVRPVAVEVSYYFAHFKNEILPDGLRVAQ